MANFEKELREEIKDWDREKLLEAYIDISKARVSIAPFPPYDWFEMFEEEDE